MKPVLYLTGAPATGKSTLSRELAKACPSLKVFAYSEQLREHIKLRNGAQPLDAQEIRAKSSQVVMPDDIAQVDLKLVEFVANNRCANPVLIDSHAVTKESYGFRVTGFAPESLKGINPTAILCMYATGQTLVERIAEKSEGRPAVDVFEAQMHCQLQASLAIQYGFALGRPVYLLDGTLAKEELVEQVLRRARLRE